MSDPALLVAIAAAVTLAIGITVAACLRGWQEWLELRRDQIAEGRPAGGPGELRELRDRVRRLEAIADGAER